MRIKSYFARTVADAIATARHELGADAMLVNSRKTRPEARHLGEYEVVFAAEPEPDPLQPAAAMPLHGGPPPAADRFSGAVAELKKQLESMRRALNKSAFAPPQWLGSSPGLSEAYALLTASEVSPELAREIVERAASRAGDKFSGEPQGVDPKWPAAIAEELESRLRIEAVLGQGDARPRIVALVGPPGAGKTTTLVKLAVNYGLASRKPVLLLSTDTYRVGAAEQLRSYAAILGVGFQVLDTVSALAQAIEEGRGKDLILIDTPGLGCADLDSSSALARLLSTRPDIDRQLVLSSSMKAADLSRVIDAYEIFRPQRLLFTRLDETTSLGPVFNEAVRTGKPLSFFATGQRIPEDLESATHGRLIELILGSSPAKVLSAA